MFFDDDDVIYSYTRQDALKDGVLVDVSALAREAGFKIPVAITEALHNTITPNEKEEKHGQSYEGRLWDVLFLASRVARCNKSSSRVNFTVLQYEINPRPRRRKLHLQMDNGPGDEGEPVITIGYPSDF